MLYQRYFIPGQRLSLRRMQPGSPGEAPLDSLSGLLVDCTQDYFDVRLPYQNPEQEGFPFFPGMPFEILAELFGLGMRVTASFEGFLAPDCIRLRSDGDLEFYYRRRHLRTDAELWLGCRRGRGTLRTLRRRWKQHADQLGGGSQPSDLPPFSRQAITLGGGGLSLKLPAPVAENELCLFYLALDDNGPLVCALAETAWTRPVDEQGLQAAGMRFLSLRETDQRRIEVFVRRRLRQGR